MEATRHQYIKQNKWEAERQMGVLDSNLFLPCFFLSDKSITGLWEGEWVPTLSWEETEGEMH